MLVRTKNNGNYLPSIFDEFFGNVIRPDENEMSFSQPDFNVFETEKEFVVEAAAPGLEKKNFEINVENNVLNISGKVEEKKEEKDKNFFYKGFCYGNFKKSYSLPENVNVDKISAEYNQVILKVNIPKEKEMKLSKQIKIS